MLAFQMESKLETHLLSVSTKPEHSIQQNLNKIGAELKQCPCDTGWESHPYINYIQRIIPLYQTSIEHVPEFIEDILPGRFTGLEAGGIFPSDQHFFFS